MIANNNDEGGCQAAAIVNSCIIILMMTITITGVLEPSSVSYVRRTAPRRYPKAALTNARFASSC